MEIRKERLVVVLEEINQTINKLEGLKNVVESIINSDDGKLQISVYDVRLFAILDEVYQRDGIVTKDELSEITRKWGKDPRGSAGYFTGANPSMKGIAGDRRALTDAGEKWVLEKRGLWGENWLRLIDEKYVGNPNTPNDAILFI